MCVAYFFLGFLLGGRWVRADAARVLSSFLVTFSPLRAFEAIFPTRVDVFSFLAIRVVVSFDLGFARRTNIAHFSPFFNYRFDLYRSSEKHADQLLALRASRLVHEGFGRCIPFHESTGNTTTPRAVPYDLLHDPVFSPLW